MKNKAKFFAIAALLLFLSNIIWMVYVLKSNHDMPRPNRNRNIIIEKLNFDKTQVEQYDKDIRVHRQTIKLAREHITALRNQLYNTLQSEYNQVAADSLIADINKAQYQIEVAHLKHFLAIRNICKPEQLSAYNKLTAELANLFPSVPIHPKAMKQ